MLSFKAEAETEVLYNSLVHCMDIISSLKLLRWFLTSGQRFTKGFLECCEDFPFVDYTQLCNSVSVLECTCTSF